jgi:tetratricopeptide (TPR) repeat protein
VDLYALFNEDILSVSEGAKVITDITANYKIDKREGSDKETVTLEIYDRNALRWDDDQKVAAFVTARDEEIQRFSRNVVSMAQDQFIDTLNKELQLAMVQYCGMIEQGLTYVIDPSSAYKDLSENPMVIDFVQFPRQTLYVKAGDCDDLSTTFCTLLESVGIPTAFITVPGHIYMAFQIKMIKADIKRNFSKTDNFIYRDDGTVWVPIETTALSQGFLKAWAAGSRQWKKYDADGQAGFIATADAWENYKPVAFSVSTIELGSPSSVDVEQRFIEELDSFVGQEIAPREQVLRDRMVSRPEDPRIFNSLGVLYARYGKYAEAEVQFELAVENDDFVPSMINLGNLNFIASDFQKAQRQYQRVLELDQDNSKALLGLSRTEYELENFGSAKALYRQLSSVSPDLAAKFTYLGPEHSTDDSARAANAEELRTKVEWEDEE